MSRIFPGWVKVVLGVLALCGALFTWWWLRGGQNWLAVHTGTDYCSPPVTRVCRSYGYWSGFGSVFPWELLGLGGIFTAVAVHWRHVNCHERGCPRVGRYPIAGGEFKYCGRHHPDWAGKHPSREHILCRHELHKAERIGGGQ